MFIDDKSEEGPKNFERIVSFSPAITEILFALNLGDKVVGVTSFCKYPEAVLDKDKYADIGTLFNTNFEKLAELNPDLVIFQKTNTMQKAKLDDMKINSMMIELKRLDQIIDVSAKIAQKTGQSDELAKTLIEQRDALIAENENKKKLKILIMVDSNYVAGAKTIYDDMIKDLNCVNAYSGNLSYPKLSAEDLIEMNPELIIQIAPDLNEKVSEDDLLNKWYEKPHLKAVENKQVYILFNSYAVLPGPRFILTMQDIATCLKKAREVYSK